MESHLGRHDAPEPRSSTFCPDFSDGQLVRTSVDGRPPARGAPPPSWLSRHICAVPPASRSLRRKRQMLDRLRNTSDPAGERFACRSPARPSLRKAGRAESYAPLARPPFRLLLSSDQFLQDPAPRAPHGGKFRTLHCGLLLANWWGWMTIAGSAFRTAGRNGTETITG